MVETRIDVETDDIYTRVMKLIENKDVDGAINLLSQQSRNIQIKTIRQLNFTLISTIDHALDRDHALDLDLALTRDRDGDSYFAYLLEKSININKIILSTLPNLGNLRVSSSFFVFSFPLTPTNLQAYALPSLQALMDMQQLFNRLDGIDDEAPELVSIESGSINITARGIKEIVANIYKSAKTIITLDIQAKKQEVEVEQVALQNDKQALENQLLHDEVSISHDTTLQETERAARLAEAELRRRDAMLTIREREVELERKEWELKKDMFQTANQ